jgi:hypothetical protein
VRALAGPHRALAAAALEEEVPDGEADDEPHAASVPRVISSSTTRATPQQ